MAKRSAGLSELEREERRRHDRERLQRAAEELLCSQGWARWVRVRAMFHSYSAGNCMLLALQCHERAIVPERVAGVSYVAEARPLRSQQREGRCGSSRRSASRSATRSVSRPASGACSSRRRSCLSSRKPTRYPGVEPVALQPPCAPLTGDSHAHLLAPLGTFARSLGYAVSFEVIEGSVGGWCDPKNKRIVVDAGAAPNAQLRTSIHECAHALGIDYQRYSRAQAEVMVDTVTLLAASSVGLAVDGETIAYVAGWGENGALEAVTEFAETIDRTARRIEEVLAGAAQTAGDTAGGVEGAVSATAGCARRAARG